MVTHLSQKELPPEREVLLQKEEADTKEGDRVNSGTESSEHINTTLFLPGDIFVFLLPQ